MSTTQPQPRWTIRQGDCLKRMTELADDLVDAVITDPPYSSGGAFRSDRNVNTTAKYMKGNTADRLPEFFGDNRGERSLLLWASLWLGEAWRVTKPGGAIAMFCDWRSYGVLADSLQVGGWTWRGVGVWVKPQHRSRPTKGGLWNDTEFILWGSKGPRDAEECLPGSWQTAAPDSATRLHTTEKPQTILRDLVHLAPPDGLILDPFTGSGSTGLAALTEHRQFLGYELSHDYTRIATERLTRHDQTGHDLPHDITGTNPGLFDQPTP